MTSIIQKYPKLRLIDPTPNNAHNVFSSKYLQLIEKFYFLHTHTFRLFIFVFCYLIINT